MSLDLLPLKPTTLPRLSAPVRKTTLDSSNSLKAGRAIQKAQRTKKCPIGMTTVSNVIRTEDERPPSAQELVAKVREAAEAGNIMYQCCFCHEGVAALEVSAVGVITRWAHPENEQAYQQWWCHLSCFERVTGETFEAEPNMEDGDE